MAAARTAVAHAGPTSMKRLLATGAAALSCCIAANAAVVEPVAPVASAASGTESGFAPSAEAAALDAARHNAAGERPVCRTDRAGAILDGRVHVRPGETLCIGLRVVGERVEPAGLVGSAASRDALVVTARQEDGRTFLTLINPLPRWLRYRAWMRPAGEGGFRYTSSCPVMSGHHLGFEDWPDLIDELALGDFTLDPADMDGVPARRVECR